MRHSTISTVLLTTLAACGGGASRDAGSDSIGNESDTGISGDGDTAESNTTSVGDGDTAETGDGDGDSGDGDTGIKFDVGELGDAGSQGCGGNGGDGDTEFSYIYICNTGQSTLTKLNTQTMIEEGRYITRPDSAGSPSRTSVNLSGDVALANRNGGVTKVYARVEDCVDSNGTPGIQTSANKDDILAWGQEECVAWYTAFPGYNTQRPVAWTAGDFNQGSCSYSNQKVWTSGSNGVTVDVVRLNGETGAVEATVPIVGVQPGGFGAYGGVVDADDGFWIMTYVSGFPLVNVREDLSYTIHTAPAEMHPYGITIDHLNRIWIATDIGGVGRFDPETETWQQIPGVTGLGIQEHPDGFMWMGTWPALGIQAIDVETMALGPNIPLPEASGQTKGVSIDFYGYVWLVDMGSSAFRIDPDTLTYDIYNQLTQPYTYSDMTGWGLANVNDPQG